MSERCDNCKHHADAPDKPEDNDYLECRVDLTNRGPVVVLPGQWCKRWEAGE